MGGSQSAPVVQKHLEQWEGALNQLSKLCEAGRHAVEHDRIYGAHTEACTRVHDREEESDDRAFSHHRSASLVSFNNAYNLPNNLDMNNNNNNNIYAATANSSSGINHHSSIGMNANIGASTSAANTLGLNRGRGLASTTITANNNNSNTNAADTRHAELRNVHGINLIMPSNNNSNAAAGNVMNPNEISCARSGGSISGPTVKHSRQQVMEHKRRRTGIFKSYVVDDPQSDIDWMQYSHFGAVAVALSYLLDGRKDCHDRRKLVTVEDIFFAAQVPLHMLHTGPPHLPVMADIIRDFLDIDNRFKDEYSLEVLHLDISPAVGEVELGPNEVGDRQTRMQLPEFQRVVTQECEEQSQVVRIVNYDPYVLEQEMLVDAYQDGGERESPLAVSVLGNPRPSQHTFDHRPCSKDNDGAYAVIVDVRNAVQLMVTIAEGIVSDSLYVKLIEVPAAALFKAMMSAESGYRARGFIRVFRRDSVAEITSDDIRPLWTPELCSGKVLGSKMQGNPISAISYHMSQHIVGVGWALHLLGGVRPGAHGYGNGLPVSHIIRTMKFDADICINGSLHLEDVYEYAQMYMQRRGLDYTVHLYPVLTKISRQDAVPTISVFDLESILLDVTHANTDPEAPQHVLLVMYNASVAHNILYLDHKVQWCVLIGYDEEMQSALLIDAHPKMFSRIWSCPLDRLHKAITGHGYMVFSRASASLYSQYRRRNEPHGHNPLLPSLHAHPPPQPPPSQPVGGTDTWMAHKQATGGGGDGTDAEVGESEGSAEATTNKHQHQQHHVGAPQLIAPTVLSRLQLIEQQNDVELHANVPSVVRTFSYPAIPVMPTMIAMACCKLGVFATFENVVQLLPYAVSALIIRTFSLESLHLCMTHYLRRTKKHHELQVSVYHGECDAQGTARLGEDDFLRLVETSLDADHALIVHFDASMLHVHGVDNPFGSLGIVMDYNAAQRSVSVTDCNPNSYMRVWSVPLSVLYGAILDSEKTRKSRSHGCLLVHRGPRTRHVFPAAHTRNFELRLLPVDSIFHPSPSPHFQGMSLAFCQLGHFYSPEEIFYEAYLTTMNDQRRRGSQAFAWRDVDVSLSVINKQIDAAFMALVCNRFLESRNAHNGGGAVQWTSAAAESMDSHATSHGESRTHDNNDIHGSTDNRSPSQTTRHDVGAHPKSSMSRTGSCGTDGSAHTRSTTMSSNHIYVELLDDIDVEDDLDTLLREATQMQDVVLLLNYDTRKAHNVSGLGRSVALVRCYDPEAKLVELWDAEFTVFGLSMIVTVDELVEMGDLDNHGRSPYGFVRFIRSNQGGSAGAASGRQKKLMLMKAPKTADEEREQNMRVAKLCVQQPCSETHDSSVR